MRKHTKDRLKTIVIVCSLIIIPLFIKETNIPEARAASLTNLSDQISTPVAAQWATHVISFTTPSGVHATADDTIVIDFDANYDVRGSGNSGYIYSWITLTWGAAGTENNVGAFASTKSGATWGAGMTNGYNEITLTAGTDITAGSKVIITVSTAGSGGIKNPPAGTYKNTIGGTFGDTGAFTLLSLTSANSQVGISASVDPSLAFTMTPTSLDFGTLSLSAIRYASNTGGGTTVPAAANTPLLTASTNGASGVLISIYDAGNGTGGLYSSTVSDLIPPAPANQLAGGTKKYGAYGLTGASGMTLAAGFSGATAATAISNTSQTFATTSGPTASGNAGLILGASINALTKAGAYTDTVTVVCTGRY